MDWTRHPRLGARSVGLLIGSLLVLTACTTAGEITDDATDQSVPTETTIADDIASGETETPGETSDRVVPPLPTPEAAWAALSQDDRNTQCSSHLDSPDQIWETLSSEGASEAEVTAYQAMLDVECSEGR